MVGCVNAFFVLVALLLAYVVHNHPSVREYWQLDNRPPVAVNCSFMQLHRNVTLPTLPDDLEALPWRCGLQEVTTTTTTTTTTTESSPNRLRVFVFTQPDGTWCWSNAGVIVYDDEILHIVDTLTDEHLTNHFIEAIQKQIVVVSTKKKRRMTPQWIFLTHGDIDHVYGLAAMRRSFVGFRGILAHQSTLDTMAKNPPPKKLAQSVMRARLVWSFFSDKNDSMSLHPWIKRLLSYGTPHVLQGYAVRFLGNLRAMQFFSPFDFDNTADVPTKDVIAFDERERHVSLSGGGGGGGNDAIMKIVHVSGTHSYGDVFLHLPSANLVFAGDLLFIGVSPIMWTGPARKFKAALHMLLATNATTFVPGHGPVCGRRGVELSLAYWDFVEAGVRQCVADGVSESRACASRLFDRLPSPWNAWLGAERVFINVDVEMNGPVVDVARKFALIGAQGEHGLLDT